MYNAKKARILDFIKDDIKPYYFENLVAYTLDNYEIKTREDIPHLLGDAADPKQRAFADYICDLLGIKG